MVYSNFRIFISMCFILGIGKVLVCSAGNIIKLNIFYKLWTLAIIGVMVLSYLIPTVATGFDEKRILRQIADLNDFLVSLCITLLNILCGTEEYEQMYDILNNIFNRMKLSEMSKKIMCLKIYMFLILPLIIFIIVMALQFVYMASPYFLLLRIPTLFTILYVSLHFYIIFYVLKIINQILSDMLLFKKKHVKISEIGKFNFIMRVIRSEVKLNLAITSNDSNLKSLCKIYDDASTCMLYLERLHGIKIVLAIWLSFSSGVVGVTLVACHESSVPLLETVLTFLPLSWCFMACYVLDQLAKEVKRMDTLIIKYLIDYRCDQTTKNILQMFKQLVNTNRLTFTAGNVFCLDYGMILGTIINIITYSIILIQLFLS